MGRLKQRIPTDRQTELTYPMNQAHHKCTAQHTEEKTSLLPLDLYVWLENLRRIAHWISADMLTCNIERWLHNNKRNMGSVREQLN